MAGHPLILSLVLAGALAVPAVAAARPFYGMVAAPSTITLKKASGANVTHASPGPRKFVISDQSSFHNFHLLGPGVSKKTGIDFTGSRTWKVTLQVGTYKYRCDAHPTTMRGSFNVS
jgi:plastocyanin